MKTRYYVWERNDGHVGCTCHEPRGWTTSAGEEVTFTIHKIFEVWNGYVTEYIERLQARVLVKMAESK